MSTRNALLILIPLLTLGALVYFLVRFIFRQSQKKGPQ